jgi:hypothetical protein
VATYSGFRRHELGSGLWALTASLPWGEGGSPGPGPAPGLSIADCARTSASPLPQLCYWVLAVSTELLPARAPRTTTDDRRPS